MLPVITIVVEACFQGTVSGLTLWARISAELSPLGYINLLAPVAGR